MINDMCKAESYNILHIFESVFSFILNIVLTNMWHENENKLIGTDA